MLAEQGLDEAKVMVHHPTGIGEEISVRDSQIQTAMRKIILRI